MYSKTATTDNNIIIYAYRVYEKDTNQFIFFELILYIIIKSIAMTSVVCEYVILGTHNIILVTIRVIIHELYKCNKEMDKSYLY